MKELIDELKYLNWKDKEMAKLRKEMIGVVQTWTLFGNRVISGAADLGFRSILYGWKDKTWAYNFHVKPKI
jgi:hypothetical protein